MSETDYLQDPEVKAALIEKYKAEAAEHLALARKESAIADHQLSMLKQQEASTDRFLRDAKFRDAGDIEHRVFRFNETITGSSVMVCEEHLTRWSRLDPGCDMTILLNSPGGIVTAGMDLYDSLLELRRKGHKLTIVARGYAASMASIVLQAADVRVMGREAYLLIHEPSGMALGSLGEIEDTTSWMTMMADRVLDIYASRCQEAGANGTAENPLTKAQLKRGWNRKDWWISSDQALKGGLVDEVR
jgi:ATP-dependent protease ClpP protease subunit